MTNTDDIIRHSQNSTLPSFDSFEEGSLENKLKISKLRAGFIQYQLKILDLDFTLGYPLIPPVSYIEILFIYCLKYHNLYKHKTLCVQVDLKKTKRKKERKGENITHQERVILLNKRVQIYSKHIFMGKKVHTKE